MMFWAATAVLVVLALALLVPALRSRTDDAPRSPAVRLAVLRDRFAELEAERTSGAIDDARYLEARAELEELAADELADANSTTERRRGAVMPLVAVAVVVPLVAYGLYAHLGTPDAPDRIAFQMPGDVRAMVDQLSARLAEHPDDLQGWMLLGRSRVVLGEMGGAVDAWRNAHRLAQDDPTVLANLAEALTLRDATALDGEAAVLAERALAADPENPKALWYAGLAAERRGDAAAAAARWRALLDQDPPEALRAAITRRLAEIERE